MALYFVFATAVQVNDPDPLLWGSFYIAAAALSFLAAWRTPPSWQPASFAIVSILWGLWLAPEAFGSSFRELFQSWQMMSTGMEVGREFLGLVIVAIWMGVLTLQARRGRTSRRTRPSS
jgi:hypothetical protein